MHQSILVRRTLLAAALFSVFTPSFAQSSNQNSAQLDTIEVVGSMNKLQEQPFKQAKSVVTIKADELSKQSVTKVDTVGRYEAGFTNQPFGSDDNTNWFRIRGTEASQAYDGAPAASYGFFTPHVNAFGVQAIEVTKGADALTFGAANSGGLINYISKRPDKDLVGKGELQTYFGTKAQSGFGADYTGALNDSQSARYRVVASYDKAKSEWRGAFNESYYFAPSLSFDFSDTTHLTVLANIQKDVGIPSSNFLPQSGTLVATDKGFIPRSFNLGDPTQDYEQNISRAIGYEFSHDFGQGLSFTQNYRFNSVTNDHQGAYAYPSAYDVTFAPLALSADNNYSVGRGVVYNSGSLRTHTLDNRLSWKVNTDKVENTVLAGIDYSHQKFDGLYTLFGSASPVNVFNPSASYGDDVSINAPKTGLNARQLGFYLQDSVKLFNTIGLTAGVRHDRITNSEVNAASLQTNHTSYSGSIMYYGPAGLNPYFAYTEAFRLPFGLSGDQTLYSPYLTKQFELGLKYVPSWLDGSMSLALFSAKDQGALVSKVGVNGAVGATVSSADPIKRQGVEFNANANLTDNFSTQVAYTYLRSVTMPISGANYYNPLIPKNTLSVFGTYNFDGGSLNGLTVGAGVRYVGTSVTSKGSLYSEAKVPSATVFDLMASYKVNRNVTAQLNVQNLSDRKYISSCDYYCYYGQGRSVVGKLSYKF